MVALLQFIFESFPHFIGSCMLFGLFAWWSITCVGAFKPLNVNIQNVHTTHPFFEEEESEGDAEEDE